MKYPFEHGLFIQEEPVIIESEKVKLSPVNKVSFLSWKICLGKQLRSLVYDPYKWIRSTHLGRACLCWRWESLELFPHHWGPSRHHGEWPQEVLWRDPYWQDRKLLITEIKFCLEYFEMTCFQLWKYFFFFVKCKHSWQKREKP